MYLGAPVFKGKPKRIHLQPITDRIKLKLASWKGVLLSSMGKVQFIKSVFHSMLIYSFHIYAWPKSLLNEINKWLRNFVWSGCVSVRKHSIVSWSKVCRPVEEGGLD